MNVFISVTGCLFCQKSCQLYLHVNCTINYKCSDILQCIFNCNDDPENSLKWSTWEKNEMSTAETRNNDDDQG